MEFERAVQVLCDGGVEFVIIGGVSAAFHGSSRVTYDLDICFSRASLKLAFSPTLAFDATHGRAVTSHPSTGEPGGWFRYSIRAANDGPPILRSAVL